MIRFIIQFFVITVLITNLIACEQIDSFLSHSGSSKNDGELPIVEISAEQVLLAGEKFQWQAVVMKNEVTDDNKQLDKDVAHTRYDFLKAKKMGFHVTILDPTFNCPAAQVSDKHIMGGFYDKEKLEQLVQETVVTTYELEHIDTSILKELFDHGHRIHPSPYVMELIQNKYEQKKLLDEKGIPVPKYKNVNNNEE